VLAYVFWHRPREGVDRKQYEEALGSFHDSLENTSAAFRLDGLPFASQDGYEDWYLVDDWAALGELNVAAVDANHRGRHDAAAGLAGEGWGGVYALVRGPAEPPPTARWQPKPPSDPEVTVWQRQMMLGPAPEYCVVDGAGTGRVPILDPHSS
jgi:hypothetical protein